MPWPMAVLVALLAFGAPSKTAAADEGLPKPSSEQPRHDVDPEARRLYQEALAHFTTGELDDAIEELWAAYAIEPAPELLYNLGQAYRRKGECGKAREAYQRFLETEPVGIARERAVGRIAELQRCTPAVPSPAVQPDLSPKPAIATPLIEQPQPSMTSSTPLRRWRQNRPALALTVTAAVLISTAAYFAWRSHEASDRVSQVFERGDAWTSSEADAERTGVWSDRLAITSGALGIGAVALAAWLFAHE